MKYQYFYQTKLNEERSGWLKARNRQDAYTQLRRQGIKPYKLIGDDPIAWKRWAAIVVLLIALIGSTITLLQLKREVAVATQEIVSAPRAQIYGDPAILKDLSVDNYQKHFPCAWDAFLARHAVPGRVCGDEKGAAIEPIIPALDPLPILPEASDEMKKLVRMINGMKDEAKAYIEAGGSATDYQILCCERSRTEAGILEQAARQFSQLRKKLADENSLVPEESVMQEWEKQNRVLRSFGLPTTPYPGEE